MAQRSLAFRLRGGLPVVLREQAVRSAARRSAAVRLARRSAGRRSFALVEPGNTCWTRCCSDAVEPGTGSCCTTVALASCCADVPLSCADVPLS